MPHLSRGVLAADLADRESGCSDGCRPRSQLRVRRARDEIRQHVVEFVKKYHQPHKYRQPHSSKGKLA